jgi:hypothetical protein
MSAEPSSNVAAAAYANAVDRLRINFRVAVWTNLLAVSVLIGSAAATTALILIGQPIAAAVPAVLSVLDLAWGVMERPWRQLWLANNRIALSDSLWVAYLETKGAIVISGLGGEDQLHELRTAQNLWVNRTASIAQDDFGKAVLDLFEINDRSEEVQSFLRGLAPELPARAIASRRDFAMAAGEGSTLDELEDE